MPTYQYRCADCGAELEVVQKFTDHALTECPACRGHLRKVYNAVGVHFKGSGFYATDNRASGSSSKTTGTQGTPTSTPSSSGGTGDSGSSSGTAQSTAATS